MSTDAKQDFVGPYPNEYDVAATPGPTPSQTVGPYFAIGLTRDVPDYPDAVEPYHGDAITITGTLHDGNGALIPDGVIEIWGADPNGRFNHPDDPRGATAYEGFTGWARSGTDPDGTWSVRTLKPGALPAADGDGQQAPHIVVTVHARGVLRQLTTRLYFSDEAEANAADPVLASLPPEAARTLIAERVEGGYHFDIHLQGDDETAFFQL